VDDESLSRVDMGGEANANVFDFIQVILKEVLLQYSNRHTVGTKSMQDGNSEASLYGHFGVHMQGVGVAGESVDKGLVEADIRVGFPVWVALGSRWKLILVRALVAEPTKITNEHTCVCLSTDLIGSFIIDFVCYDQNRSGALILHIENLHPTDVVGPRL